jgi:hypothetical protein
MGGQMTDPKWGSRQAFVDHQVMACLNRGVRTREGMALEITNRTSVERDDPVCAFLSAVSTRKIYHLISLKCSRTDEKTGHRPIWCVPGEGRYVSVQRVRFLVRKKDDCHRSMAFSKFTDEEWGELHDSLQDLALIKSHWLEKIARARANVTQLEALEEFASTREML